MSRSSASRFDSVHSCPGDAPAASAKRKLESQSRRHLAPPHARVLAMLDDDWTNVESVDGHSWILPPPAEAEADTPPWLLEAENTVATLARPVASEIVEEQEAPPRAPPSTPVTPTSLGVTKDTPYRGVSAARTRPAAAANVWAPPRPREPRPVVGNTLDERRSARHGLMQRVATRVALRRGERAAAVRARAGQARRVAHDA
eukprot:284190-Prymnesium_polylepis.1